MRIWQFLVFVSLVVFTCLSVSANSAQSVDPDKSSESDAEVSVEDDAVSDPLESEISPKMRLDIKRQVMSRPGVFLDMSNLTDNGYIWSNDVVWEGSDLTANQKWYIAGFLFQRPRYKGVWLQYAFTLEQESGLIKDFARWYGTGSFR